MGHGIVSPRGGSRSVGSVGSVGRCRITMRFLAAIRHAISAITAIRPAIIGIRVGTSCAFICAGFTSTAITAIIRGDLAEGYLFGRVIPAAAGLDAGGHKQGQHFLDASPQPTRRLGPRLVSGHVYALHFGYLFEQG